MCLLYGDTHLLLENFKEAIFKEIEQKIKTLRGKATPVLMITHRWGGEAASAKSDTLQHPNLLMLLFMFEIMFYSSFGVLLKFFLINLLRATTAKNLLKWIIEKKLLLKRIFLTLNSKFLANLSQVKTENIFLRPRCKGLKTKCMKSGCNMFKNLKTFIDD